MAPNTRKTLENQGDSLWQEEGLIREHQGSMCDRIYDLPFPRSEFRSIRVLSVGLLAGVASPRERSIAPRLHKGESCRYLDAEQLRLGSHAAGMLSSR